MISPDDFDDPNNRSGIWVQPRPDAVVHPEPVSTAVQKNSSATMGWVIATFIGLIVLLFVWVIYQDHRTAELKRQQEERARIEQVAEERRQEEARLEEERRKQEEAKAGAERKKREEEAQDELAKRASSQLLESELEEARRFPRIVDLELTDSCAKQGLYAAVRYESVVGAWVTAGWWHVEPGASVHVTIPSTTSQMYFYADGAVSGQWEASGTDTIATVEIPHNGFRIKDGEPVIGHGIRTVKMFSRSFNDLQREQRFSCEAN